MRKIKLIFTRDFDQWIEEMVRNSLVFDFPKIWGQGLSDQIVRFTGKTFEWYRYEDDMLKLKDFMVHKPLNDQIYKKSNQNKFLKLVSEIRRLISIEPENIADLTVHLDKITFKFSEMYPYYPLGIFIPGPWRQDFLANHKDTGRKMVDFLMKSRSQSEGLLKEVGNYLRNWLEPILKKNRYPKEYARLLSVNEVKRIIVNNRLPLKGIIKERSLGYIFMGGKIINTTDFEGFLAANGLFIEKDPDEDKTTIHGSVAFPKDSLIRGRVKLVFNSYDAKSFKKGYILVTPMTAPDFLWAMKNSLAIITDEGGITSHAAIVARELKKPCIIGTKIATKILHDGDLVEVDADKGVVRILNKAKENK